MVLVATFTVQFKISIYLLLFSHIQYIQSQIMIIWHLLEAFVLASSCLKGDGTYVLLYA
jgi:hypothetical protein